MTATARCADSLAAYATPFNDIDALKRTRRAGSPYSVGTSLFLRAWDALASGRDAAAVAHEVTAVALAASQLGAIDGAVLAQAGVDAARRAHIIASAFDRAAVPLAPAARDRLRAALPASYDLVDAGSPPPFALRLAHQPRAGATAPGAPRFVLEPPEMHADHCFAVAVYAVMCASRYGADGTDAFVLAMAHHMHNAELPDAGFAGELLLGDALDGIVETLTAAALGTLAPALRGRIERVRSEVLPGAATPEAQAFHAADVIDRVLQVRQYARMAEFTMSVALDDLQLVHPGPVEAFHATVLTEVGLR